MKELVHEQVYQIGDLHLYEFTTNTPVHLSKRLSPVEPINQGSQGSGLYSKYIGWCETTLSNYGKRSNVASILYDSLETPVRELLSILGMHIDTTYETGSDPKSIYLRTVFTVITDRELTLREKKDIFAYASTFEYKKNDSRLLCKDTLSINTPIGSFELSTGFYDKDMTYEFYDPTNPDEY